MYCSATATAVARQYKACLGVGLLTDPSTYKWFKKGPSDGRPVKCSLTDLKDTDRPNKTMPRIHAVRLRARTRQAGEEEEMMVLDWTLLESPEQRSGLYAGSRIWRFRIRDPVESDTPGVALVVWP
jgi:hypothetical protein